MKIEYGGVDYSKNYYIALMYIYLQVYSFILVYKCVVVLNNISIIIYSKNNTNGQFTQINTLRDLVEYDDRFGSLDEDFETGMVSYVGLLHLFITDKSQLRKNVSNYYSRLSKKCLI